MPEEINRVLTDQIADRLYTTERSAHANLAREGIANERMCFVGNVMIDSLLANRELAHPPAITLQAAGVDPAFLTILRAMVWSLCTDHPMSIMRRNWHHSWACCVKSQRKSPLSLPCIHARVPTLNVSVSGNC
jgi:hypothetical protein